VVLNESARSVRLERALLLDLGAVAKGLAIDMAVQELRPLANFVVDAGGDVYCGGHNAAEQSWTVGIRHPRESHALLTRVAITDAALCTSGDYERRVADDTAGEHHLLDPTTGATHTLAADAADFDGLTWHANGTAIAVLRGTKAATQKHRVNTLHAWTGVTASSARAVVFDPATVSNFPKDFVVSESSAPRWSTDGARLFIGIKAQEPEVAAADSVKANVDVWHYKDQTVQSVQIVQIQQQRRATLPAVVELSTGTFTALGTDAMRAVTHAANCMGITVQEFDALAKAQREVEG
jgi:hypothetical protein